eukprot:TRINITY_DN2211_c0_g1_i1.p1 TRINITY_DN2211_c0_g1~~TRINITY_DN2211_c0_g1_i1.p1  ORF type:complete len:240 (-),score=57.33 TRINITY_DN2211_c0_g1_i1:110-829(-)
MDLSEIRQFGGISGLRSTTEIERPLTRIERLQQVVPHAPLDVYKVCLAAHPNFEQASELLVQYYGDNLPKDPDEKEDVEELVVTNKVIKVITGDEELSIVIEKSEKKLDDDVLLDVSRSVQIQVREKISEKTGLPIASIRVDPSPTTFEDADTFRLVQRGESDEKWTFSVRGKGEIVEIIVDPMDTVFDLKLALGSKFDVPLNRQSIISIGRVLHDDQMLQDYYLEDGSTVTLQVKRYL